MSIGHPDLGAPQRRSWTSLASVAAILLLPCCTGLWGDATSGESSESDVDRATTPEAAVAEMPGGTCSVAPVPAQRLTKLEYNNAIRDLFGLEKDYTAGFSDDSEGPAGFTTEGVSQNLSRSQVNDYMNAAKTVVGDVFAANPNRLLTCSSGDACAETILTALATKAFRQPPSADEVKRLLAVYKASSSRVFTDALKLAVKAILLSPRFLFRVYALPATDTTLTPLGDHELASRLSFFIWGSIPDEALLADAAKGRLQKEDVLEGHVVRMLADRRVSYLANGFGYQWLKLDRFDRNTNLDTARFPTWNESLKTSMRHETLAVLDNVFARDASVMDFVAGKYTFIDQNLSRHYGIPRPAGSGSQFTKVAVDEKRIGVLTNASILALTSVSNRTAPVRRGKWMLEQILCSGTGAPPPNIPALPPPPSGSTDLQVESKIRQRMAQHTQQGAACAGCHNVLDPIGFAYENYDAAGVWRTTYTDGAPVDASGKLPSGEAFDDFAGLGRLVQSDARFPSCFTKRLASFAEGRDLTGDADKCAMQPIADASVGPARKFSDLVVRLVLDASFRSRRVGPREEQEP